MAHDRLDLRRTHAVQLCFDRLAPHYDALMRRFERRAAAWRERAWGLLRGPEVLEVGVGTGANIPYYPPEWHVTGIDISHRMLERAQARARHLGANATLRLMDAQALAYPDDSFDSAIGTLVFCNVANPVRGLRELARVVRPGGRVVLIEHGRADAPLLGALMDLLNPLSVALGGEHLTRRMAAVSRAEPALDVLQVDSLTRYGIVKLIVAGVRAAEG